MPALEEAVARITFALCGRGHGVGEFLDIEYVPGFTAAQRDFGSCDDITLTEDNAIEYLKSLIDGLIARGSFDGHCESCGSPRGDWAFFDWPLSWRRQKV